jgi:hypothetical protein
MPHALARAASAFEEHQGALRQIGHCLIQRLQEFQHPKNAQQHDKISAVTRFDPLHRALRDTGFLSQLGLRQSRIDSAPLQAAANFMKHRHIRQFGGDFHPISPRETLNSSVWAIF